MCLLYPGCTNAPQKGKGCHKCNRRRQKEINPYGYHYDLFVQNVKRRNKVKIEKGQQPIPMDLSRAEFEKFAIEVDLLRGRGRTATAYHIGRINEDPELGYIGYRKDNIKKQTNADNKKQDNDRRRAIKKKIEYDWFFKTGTTVTTEETPTGTPEPF